jgi:hypothetical protein
MQHMFQTHNKPSSLTISNAYGGAAIVVDTARVELSNATLRNVGSATAISLAQPHVWQLAGRVNRRLFFWLFD